MRRRASTTWPGLVLVLCLAATPVPGWCQGEDAGQAAAARGPLPDWSWAGTPAAAEASAAGPAPPAAASVLDFGAIGDGVADDSQAFAAAVASLPRGGIVRVPDGWFLLAQPLRITTPGVVLRGDSIGGSRLLLPATGPAGGMIQFRGSEEPAVLATVVRDAGRGQTQLAVAGAGALAPGQRVRLVVGRPGGGELSFSSLVASVGDGSVQLQRRLPFDVSAQDGARLLAFDASLPLQGAGLQSLTIQAAEAPAGIEQAARVVAASFDTVADCVVRDVTVIDAGASLVLTNAHHCTVDGLSVVSSPGAQAGGTGLRLDGGADTLVTGFRAASRMGHDIALAGVQAGTVITNSSGVDLSIQLAGTPVDVLVSNVDVGRGRRPWGRLAGAAARPGGSVLAWNVRDARGASVAAPPGLAVAVPSVAAAGTELPPADLYAAQLAARLGPAAALPTAAVAQAAPSYGCSGMSRCSIGGSSSGLPACPATYTVPSVHFGCAGELWTPGGRLASEWSWAGYAQGDKPIPVLPVAANVTAFGAVGDGKANDTAAFERAIAATASGVIFVPRGTFRLTKVLDIRKPIVLRGAGKDRTKLLFPYSLTQLYGNKWSEGYAGSNVSDYSHGTGFLNWWGWDPVSPKWSVLTNITAPALRGTKTLQVQSAAGLSVGQWVRVNLDDPGDGSLLLDMNGYYLPGGSAQKGSSNLIRQVTRITAISGKTIQLATPLTANVSLSSRPTLHKLMPLFQNAGIEDLTIEFPLTTYPGHLREQGYNGVHFNQLYNSWVRNVRFINSDSAFYSWGSSFLTVTGVEVAVSGNRGTLCGHRGLWFERGSYNFITNFNISCTTFHDLSVSYAEQASVFANGAGKDLSCDHHRAAPYANLWTNLDTGLGSRPFLSSGGAANGPSTSSFTTFWGLRGTLAARLPPYGFGPLVNFMGLNTPDANTSPYNWSLEKARPLGPSTDLWSLMRATRAARLARV